MSSRPLRTAGRALVDQLTLQGVCDVFSVPGESYLEVLDALHDSDIRMTVCRQEGGAAMMADAVGRATGSPGVFFVTRGPGATNASTGLLISQLDGVPVVMFAGQVDLAVQGRGAWQEFDFHAAFSGMAKWVVQIDDPDRVGEIVSRAFRIAASGRPGPVVVVMPRDVMRRPSASPDGAPFRAAEPAPGADDMAAFHALISGALRPIAIVGGGGWTDAGRASFAAFAERFDVPVVTSYRRGPLFDPDHRCYAGDLGLGANPALIARIKGADMIALIGGRLGQVPSQDYTLLDLPVPSQALIHVYPEAEELGRVYAPTLGIVAGPDRFARALEEMAAPIVRPWADETAAVHASYRQWSQSPGPQPGEVNLGEIMVWLREHLAQDAIICNGAGGYAAWLHRYYRFRQAGTHIAPAAASMGYGVPAAVAMKRLYPERQVVCLAGDGDFLMNGQEVATAAQYGLAFVTVVIDNGSYGSIRILQEQAHPGRPYSTDLKNPDFAAYARAFGGFGVTVERTADFAAAFEAAQASGLPAIVHLKVDIEAATPGATLSQIRAQAEARARA